MGTRSTNRLVVRGNKNTPVSPHLDPVQRPDAVSKVGLDGNRCGTARTAQLDADVGAADHTAQMNVAVDRPRGRHDRCAEPRDHLGPGGDEAD